MDSVPIRSPPLLFFKKLWVLDFTKGNSESISILPLTKSKVANNFSTSWWTMLMEEAAAVEATRVRCWSKYRFSFGGWAVQEEKHFSLKLHLIDQHAATQSGIKKKTPYSNWQSLQTDPFTLIHLARSQNTGYVRQTMTFSSLARTFQSARGWFLKMRMEDGRRHRRKS